MRQTREFLAALTVALVAGALAAASADAYVIYDQYDPGNPPPDGAIASQDENLNGTYDNGEVRGADDFAVPTGDYWRVREVDAKGFYKGRFYQQGNITRSTAAGPAQSVDVYFYRDNGGTPSGGALIASRVARGFTNASTAEPLSWGYGDGPGGVYLAGADLQIQLDDPVNLPSGTYWVAVWARQDAGVHGYWDWQTDGTGHDAYAMMYAQSGCPTSGWQRVVDCATNVGPDLSFRLNGEFMDGLTYRTVGDGKGTVTSTGGASYSDFNCGPDDCRTQAAFKRFARGFQVTFQARANTSGPNSVFSGWQGCDHPSGTTCVMDMNSPGHEKKLKAQFDVTSGLTIRKIGKSDGSVTSDPAKVNCPVGVCTTQASYYRFPVGSQVWLIARNSSSSPNSLFVGWQGCDHPWGGLCLMDMNDAAHTKKVYADYEPASGLTIRKLGAGDGTISSTPAKVKCDIGVCKTQAYYYKFLTGSKVTLKAAPRANPKSTFGGWQGCDHPSGLSCVMDMDNTQHSKNVHATFN